MKKHKHRLLKGFTTHLVTLCGFCTFLLVMGFTPLSLQAQNGNETMKVSGVVKDNLQEALIGVSVSIKGKGLGTISDLTGAYSISAKEGDVLRFSSIGYKDQEFTVTGGVLNVALEESAKALEEVVIEAGYGTMKKRDVTGSITSIDAKSIESRVPTSVMDALEGAAPGVRVLSSSGALGEEASIRIRGTSTFSEDGVSPLYVVDGMAVDNMNNINPNDILSMEILKDAASSAIYGSRSANGVIIITTKSGGLGVKPKIEAKFLQSYAFLSHKLPQTNRFEHNIYRNSIPVYGKGVPLLNSSSDSVSLMSNNDTDFQNLITQLGVRNQFDLSVSGGTKDFKYFNSLQYYDETGIILTSYLKRITDRINMEYSPSSILTLGSRISLGYSANNVIDEAGTLARGNKMPPNTLLRLPNGDFPGGSIKRNPLMQLYDMKNELTKYNLTAFEYLDLKPLSWLSFHSDLGGTFDVHRVEIFTPSIVSTTVPKINSGSDMTSLISTLSGNAYFTTKNSFNSVHNTELVAGTSISYWGTTTINLAGQNYVTESVNTMNSASKLLPNQINTLKDEHTLVGFFLRAHYDYKSKYLLNATVREDGSSRFGSENKWGYFPSVSLAWRMSEETFFNWAKPALTDAKMRSSWGVTGNERIGNYDSQTSYTFGSYYYDGSSGVVPNSTLGNPKIKWEETKQSNLGLDLSFLEGKVKLVTDVYLKNTDGLLFNRPLPNESGYSTVRLNYGAIQNKGVEISLTVNPVKTKEFMWSSTINYSQNHNIITSLADAGYAASSIYWVGEGYATGTFYGYKNLGVYKYDESNAWTTDFKTNLVPVFKTDNLGNTLFSRTGQPTLLKYTYPDGKDFTGTPIKKTANGQVSKGGDVIWEDYTADGDINSSDRQVLGSAQPKWEGSWNNTFRYKQFGLNVFINGCFGNKVYNSQLNDQNGIASVNYPTIPVYVYNIWKYPGQNTFMYAFGSRVVENNRVGNSAYIEDGSFIRLQTVRLSYTVNPMLMKMLKMQSLMVYLYGNNLLIWTNYRGYDPEVNQNSVLTPGNDSGRLPRKREFGLGLNLTF